MNTALQRWVSADPLEIHSAGEADANLYAYVSGQAFKVVDPLGLDAASDAEAAGRAAGEAQRASSQATERMMHGGLVLEVVGGGEPMTELRDLQALTDDELMVVENGTTEDSRIRRFTVGLRSSGDGEKAKGTELVRRLVMNEHRTAVRQTGGSGRLVYCIIGTWWI